MIKFKDNHDSVYTYSLARTAMTPVKNKSELCSCTVHLQDHKSNEEVISKLKITEQTFSGGSDIAMTSQQFIQSETPFLIKLTENGDVNAILTEVDESHRSLSVKNQVVQTLLLNRTLYKSFIDRKEKEFLVDVDLSTQLPFGPCNASVTVEDLGQDYKVRILVKADMCWELSLGSVVLTNHSKYEVTTMIEKEGLKLKELNEETLLEIVIKNDGRKAVSTYAYHLIFDKYVEKEKFDVENLTVSRDKVNRLSDQYKKLNFLVYRRSILKRT